MCPQFNLLKGRIKVGSGDWGFDSFMLSGGRSWCAFWVRRGVFSHYQLRRVKGVIPYEEN